MAEWIASPNFKPGRTERVKYIVIHHWDDPAKKPTINGVVNHFKNPKIEVAAHYVVSGDRIIQMVKESDTAWHTRAANPHTIGIEVDPNVPGNTYATVGRLVQEIRKRHGNLPLRKHSDFVNTSCPGNLDLARIDQESKGIVQEEDMKLNKGQVMRLYQLLRGDEGDDTGLSYFTNKELDDVQREMLNSDEYKTRVLISRQEFEELKRKASAGTADPAVVEKARRYDLLKEALK